MESPVIRQEDLTNLMADRETICDKVNDVISPKKKIRRAENVRYKGVNLDGIHVTSEGFWSALIFPRWVVLEGRWNWTKEYRFTCDENGNFLAWVF
jgi:hypothetical protein